MKKTITFLFFIILAFSNAAPYADTIEMGIFPYASTSKLISHHKNIKKHFDKNSSHTLSLVTAKGFPAYFKNLLKHKYDIIYAPPHVARYLELKHNYQRVVMTSHNIRGIILVKKSSSFETIKDLENKTVSMGPEKTILHQIAVKQLKDVGLVNNKNISIKTVNTHNNAIFNAVSGDSDAAVTGIKLWLKLHKKHKSQLKVLGKTDKTTGFVLMARPEMKQELVQHIQKTLLTFNNSIFGKNYLFKGLKPITDKEMESLDPYAMIFQ